MNRQGDGDGEDAGRDEVALGESEARYRALADAAMEAVAIHEDGRFVEVNETFTRLFGYAREEALGLPITVIIDSSSMETAKEDIRRPRGEPREYLARHKDGSTFPIELAARSCAYQGRPARVVVVRDLTEQRRSEAAVKAIEARLLVADRMAALGTLAAGVAHEINNPLSYVIANVGLVAARLRRFSEEGDAPPDRETLLATIAALDEAREGAERVHRIVTDLKTFAHHDDDRKSAVDVRRGLEAALRVADHEIRPRARLVLELGDVPLVLGTDASLAQVFVNLIVNAAQAIPAGAPDDNEIRVVARRDDAGRAVVEVRDTGPGIPPVSLGRVFDPFFTGKPFGAGTGLGLSVCHGIVASLEGDIEVESRLGEGATFRVVLPPAPSDAPEAVRPSVPPSSRASTPHRGRILVVDDEPLVGRMVERALSRQHHVATVTSGHAALERLLAGERFDLILCDLMMPEMTGMDLYERVESLAADQAERMVFLTGGAFTRRGREFLEHRPCLEKPFDLSALEAVVRDRVG